MVHMNQCETKECRRLHHRMPPLSLLLQYVSWPQRTASGPARFGCALALSFLHMPPGTQTLQTEGSECSVTTQVQQQQDVGDSDVGSCASMALHSNINLVRVSIAIRRSL